MKNLYIILFLIFTPLSMWGQCAVEWQDDAAIWQDDTAMWTLDDTGECEKKVKPPLSIFPNPTSVFFEIRNYETTEGAIFDTTGRFIKKINCSEMVNITDLGAGIYLLHIENQVFKIVKQ